jgi:hypothetical protein
MDKSAAEYKSELFLQDAHGNGKSYNLTRKEALDNNPTSEPISRLARQIGNFV